MISDSITDCGHGLPVGESVKDNLGNGYVNMINALLTAKYPAQGIRVLNTGISGNTVLDLQGRWEQDVLALKPDWLSVMIGINDVWRQFDRTHPGQSDAPALLRLCCADQPGRRRNLLTNYE
jgi:lysophospholipase L1-like esterase